MSEKQTDKIFEKQEDEIPKFTRKCHVWEMNKRTGRKEKTTDIPYRTWIAAGKPTIHRQYWTKDFEGHYYDGSGKVLNDEQLLKLGFDKVNQTYGPTEGILKGIEKAKKMAEEKFGYDLAKNQLGIK